MVGWERADTDVDERNEKREGAGRLAIRPLGAGGELLPLLLLTDRAAGY